MKDENHAHAKQSKEYILTDFLNKISHACLCLLFCDAWLHATCVLKYYHYDYYCKELNVIRRRISKSQKWWEAFLPFFCCADVSLQKRSCSWTMNVYYKLSILIFVLCEDWMACCSVIPVHLCQMLSARQTYAQGRQIQSNGNNCTINTAKIFDPSCSRAGWLSFL